MIRWHPWCSARARCCAIFACCGRFALISCQELASGGETFGSRPVPFGTCSAAYTSYSCTPVYMNPEQEIELVLDNPRSAHILRMPGISKASAVVVHQIFHTHAKASCLGEH